MSVKRLFVAALLAAVLVGGGAVYWFTRADPLPVIDLAGAEPEVRAVIDTALADVAKKPKSAEAWGRLAHALLANGYDDDAMPALERAAKLDPAQPRWPYLRARRLMTIDRAKGRELLERAVKLTERADPENVAPKLLYAEAMSEANDHARTIELANEVLAKEPNNPRAHLYLGISYLQTDDPKKAHAHFLRAAESPHVRKRACGHLAQTSLRLGDATASEQFSRNARELPPDLLPIDSYVAEYLTLTAGKQARYREAEKLEAERRMRESMSLLQELADTSGDVRSGSALGVALVKMGDNAGAEKVLREALKLGDSPAAYYALAVAQFNQAQALLDQDETKKAMAKFREAEASALAALAAKPDHANAHLFLGKARVHLGKRGEAIADFRRAIACRPELAGPHAALGEALAEAGHLDEARRALKQAIALAASYDPAGKQAQRALARIDKQ